MIRGQIIITLTDGQIISYANKYLTAKTGTDNAGTAPVIGPDGNQILKADGTGMTKDISTPLFAGFPEYSYYYTGAGEDKFEDQTGLGKIKGDFDYLVDQLGVAGNTLLRFPEADADHGDTTELVRKSTSTVSGIGVDSNMRAQVLTEEVVSIKIKEDWVNYPKGRESGYQLSKQSPNFLGFQETKERKEKGFDCGPDFNAHITYDTGFLPNPILTMEEGELIIKNEAEYDDVSINVLNDIGYEVYGIKNGKKSGISFIAF